MSGGSAAVRRHRPWPGPDRPSPARSPACRWTRPAPGPDTLGHGTPERSCPCLRRYRADCGRRPGRGTWLRPERPWGSRLGFGHMSWPGRRSCPVASEDRLLPWERESHGIPETRSAGQGRSVHELVAEASDGDQMAWTMPIFLDLLAQSLDVDVQGLCVADVINAPDFVDQVLTGEEPPLPGEEQLQELELLWSHGDGISPDEHLVAFGIQLDRPPGQLAGQRGLRGDRHLGPAQVSAYPGYQLPHRERLRHIVVGTELEPRHLVRLGVLGGQDDDGDLRLGPDCAADVQSRQLRQHEVEDHDRRLLGPEPLQRLLPIHGREDGESLAGEAVGEAVRKGRLVLDDEDAPRGRGLHAHRAAPGGGVTNRRHETISSWLAITGWEASVNSRNCPVIRKATSSPMSTAWSPTRSNWRETRSMRIPHSRACGSFAMSTTSRYMFRFSRSTGSSMVWSCSARWASRLAKASIAERSIVPTRSPISRRWATTVSLAGRSIVSLASLAMFTAWSPTRSRWRFACMIAETRRRSEATGVWVANRPRMRCSISR